MLISMSYQQKLKSLSFCATFNSFILLVSTIVHFLSIYPLVTHRCEPKGFAYYRLRMASVKVNLVNREQEKKCMEHSEINQDLNTVPPQRVSTI